MMMEANFHPIDLQAWPRGQMFYYFSKMAPTGYSLTVELDITVLKAALKERKLKFFPVYLWLATTIINRQIEFKVAVKDEVLGYWDTLTPMYAVFHEDDQTISLMWTEYDDKFSVFYERYLENQQKYGHQHGVLSQSDRMPPENSYTISCIPWIEFKHFSLQSFENKSYYFPTVEAGRIFEKNERLMLPLSMTLNHATTDGWHVKKFLDDLQHAMNHPKEWL
ncbi:CatA-like O-acetyltransferase [Wukongibacter baidiensis]|uniref:CatA-like O-acetyltransferase n=1 Tax=Wukongibacter baidiensis TaxID=1723361 RepID=UPI003D7F8767